MAQRTHYWSCSKFADWLRGTPKPGAQTSEGWDAWRKVAKKAYPIRYWIAEEGLDKIQGFIWWPIDKLHELKYYINNRWVTRTHQLTAHPSQIKPGEWRDVGNRFLPCLFNELVDFVEVEKAWSNIAWNKEAREKYNPPFWGWGWFRWRTWRCPEAGIDHLKWEMTLTDAEWREEDSKDHAEPTDQATSAKEILELYTWWKEVYPTRPDPHDASGWSELCARRRERRRAQDPDADEFTLLFSDDTTPEGKAETIRVLDLCRKIEEDYEAEDERMLIRLIKVRNRLWT